MKLINLIIEFFLQDEEMNHCDEVLKAAKDNRLMCYASHR